MCLACSYLPKFSGLLSQILWLAAGCWLSWSLRQRREKVAAGITLLSCRCLLVWVAVQLPGHPLRVSLVVWWMCPASKLACVLLGPWALPCVWKRSYLIATFQFLSFEWCQLISWCVHDGVVNFLVMWLDNILVICWRRGERKTQHIVFECLCGNLLCPPWQKIEIVLS